MTITTKDLEAGGLKQPDQTGWKGGAAGDKKKGVKKPNPKKK